MGWGKEGGGIEEDHEAHVAYVDDDDSFGCDCRDDDEDCEGHADGHDCNVIKDGGNVFGIVGGVDGEVGHDNLAPGEQDK